MKSKSLFAVLVIVATAGCNQSPAPVPSAKASDGKGATSTQPPIKVSRITPTRKTLVRVVEQPGQVEAFEEAPLYSKVTGYVESLKVDLGDRVKGPQFDSTGNVVEPGQVLCELSVPEVIEELHQKKALIELAEANVQQANSIIDVANAGREAAGAKVLEAEAAARRDVAVYERWKSESTRTSELAKSGAVGQRVADETESQFRAAEADRLQSEAKVQSAKAAVGEAQSQFEKAKADLVAAQARTKVAIADVRRTEAMLEYSKIRAPFDGRIAARNIHPGHLVRSTNGASESPVFVVCRVDKVRIKIDVPEADAVLIQEGAEAKVRIPSLPGTAFSSKVSRTGWSLDPATRTLRVETDVDNPDGILRSGMYVSVEVKAAVRENVVSLPRTAIITQDKATFCHVVDSTSVVRRVPVQLGIQSGTDVEISSGLSGEEKVIGTNSSAFKEGQVVEIVENPARS